MFLTPRPRIRCVVCKLSPPYPGSDDCLHCTVASELHEGCLNLAFWRKAEAGTPWLVKIEAELVRQRRAIEEFLLGGV